MLRKFLARNEVSIGISFLVFFALFNLATALRSPLPWLDEISYSDPAATWFFEGVFQSSLWTQGGPGFWVGNVPLHQFLLCIWFKLLGYSPYVVRGATLVYYLLGLAILWQTIRRTSFLRDSFTRLTFLLMGVSATGCVAVYRNGRYDALGFLLVCLAVSAACRPLGDRRFDPLLFASAALMPWAGLQVIPFFGIATLFYVGFLKRSGVQRFLVANFGLAFGVASLLAFYFATGNLSRFLAAMGTQGHVWVDLVVALFLNPTSLVMVSFGTGLILARRNRGLFGEPSFTHGAAVALIALGASAPWVMHFAAKYTIYYSWMATLPCMAGVLCYWEQCRNSVLKVAAAFIIAVSLLPGYPRRVVNIAVGSDYARQKQTHLFVGKHIAAKDCVLMEMGPSSLAAYYSARMQAKRILFDVTESIDPSVAKNITCVFSESPNAEQQLQSRLGGSWQQAGSVQFKPVHVSRVLRMLGANSSTGFLAIYRRL